MRKPIPTLFLIITISAGILTGCNVMSVDPELLSEQVEAAMQRATEAGNEALRKAEEDKLKSVNIQDIYDANKMSNILKHKDSCMIHILYDTFDNSNAFLYNTADCYYSEYPGVRQVVKGRHIVCGYDADSVNDGYDGYYIGYTVDEEFGDFSKYIEEGQMFDLETMFDEEVLEIKHNGDNTISMMTGVAEEAVIRDLGDEYEEGMYGRGVYTFEKDTLIFTKIVSTLYDRDGSKLYESMVLLDFNEPVPDGMQDLLDRIDESEYADDADKPAM